MLLDVPLGRFGFTKTASLLKVYFLCRGLLTVRGQLSIGRFEFW
ncbi:DUF645 family protein [Vibrio cholerae]|nr:DUF645 family protein [Vibrio cholerae]MCD6658149.1 DUF645 family protein [Vibrio cholerae]MDQ4623527.1 DUF645 family protein [Vibrio cholerae]MDQ4696026.1 DUF645 family protein [Vibrio cholerae]